jgi:hypothetical protein
MKELVCKKPLKMRRPYDDVLEQNLTKDKLYKIVNITTEALMIIDDVDDHHSFALDKRDESFYGKWFYTIKEARSEKLKILLNEK